MKWICPIGKRYHTIYLGMKRVFYSKLKMPPNFRYRMVITQIQWIDIWILLQVSKG